MISWIYARSDADTGQLLMAYYEGDERHFAPFISGKFHH